MRLGLRIGLWRALGDGWIARSPGPELIVVAEMDCPLGGPFAGAVDESALEEDFGGVVMEGANHGGVEGGEVDEG